MSIITWGFMSTNDVKGLPIKISCLLKASSVLCFPQVPLEQGTMSRKCRSHLSRARPSVQNWPSPSSWPSPSAWHSLECLFFFFFFFSFFLVAATQYGQFSIIHKLQSSNRVTSRTSCRSLSNIHGKECLQRHLLEF